jgi:hypothetical protein
MAVREVLPGLYERTESTKDVKLTREFVEAVRRYSGSAVLGKIMEDAIRKQEAAQAARSGESHSPPRSCS